MTIGTRGAGASSGRHIVAETEFNDRSSTRDAVNARTYADFYLFDGFTATVNASLENSNYKFTSFENKLVGGRSGFRTFVKRLDKNDYCYFQPVVAVQQIIRLA